MNNDPIRDLPRRWYDVAADENYGDETRRIHRECANQLEDALAELRPRGEDDMSTLKKDIAALAEDEAVMHAVRVLTDKGINGTMFEKLMRPPKIAYTIHQDDGAGRCTACGTAWPDECEVEKNVVWL